MKEIFTVKCDKEMMRGKYQQCFLFYKKNVRDNFAKTMESLNSDSAVFIRFDQTLFLLIDYPTEKGFLKGQKIIKDFALESALEITKNTPRKTGLKYDTNKL